MSCKPAVFTLALVVVIVAPDVAGAGITRVDGSGPDVSVRVTDEAAGNKNLIGISENADGTLVVSDVSNDTSSVVAEGNCSQSSPTTVVCAADPTNTRSLEVTSGEGDDAVSVALPRRALSGVATIFVNGGNGADFISGSAGPDTLEGDGLSGTGASIASGLANPGEDILLGHGDRDTLRGGEETDYLNGAGGTTGPDEANVLEGGPGSDYFDLGTSLGADRVIGGGDERGTFTSITVNGVQLATRAGDTASYSARTFSTSGTAGVTADIDASADDGATGAAEGDQIDPDVEALIGSVRDDRLVGSSAVNRLEGGLGVDSLATGGGSDTLLFADGVRDRCYTVAAGVTVLLDLTDPTLDDCRISIFPVSTKLTRAPVDETMPPPAIGSTVRRAGRTKLIATIRCEREAPKACAGKLTAEPARGGKRIARGAYRVPPGGSRRVVLTARTAAVGALRTARFTAVGRGVSRRGLTTVIAQRRVR